MHSLRLVVITQSKDTNDEHAIIEKLFNAGLRTLHVRKPRYSRPRMRDFILRVPKQYRERLVLHSHYSLASRFKLKGIHLTEEARVSGLKSWLRYQFYRRLRPSLNISASYHTLTEVEELRTRYDYIFLSPVFESISKKDDRKPLRHSRVQDSLRLTKAKVIALGGVDETKILACRDMGFYGVALFGSIWLAPNPVKIFNDVNEICKVTSPIQ